MKTLWFVLGIVSVGLGLIGVFLPILPTVPFILLSAFCFSRSSERLHQWLVNHPTFGAPIKDWQERGAISRKAKYLATGSIVLVVLLSLALNLEGYILLIQVLLLCCVLLFIWTRPHA